MSSTPVQFCLRSEPPKAAGVPAPSIFLPMKAGDSAPPQVKVAPIPLPASRPGVSDDVPLLLRNVNPDVMAAADKDKCRIDMGTRPDAPDLAAYQRVPVHEFGYALLAGMGWSKGAPIGRSNPQVVEPFEYVRRPYLLGLGAQAIPPSLDLPSMTGKKRKKHRSAPEMVDPKTGRARYTKGIDEVLVERDRPINVGDRVRIGAGPYATLTGVVNSLGDLATVALDLNHRPVRIVLRDLSRTSDVVMASKLDPARSSTPSASLTWVVPDIVVRVVSKARRWQRWYSCKGRVYDIMSSTQFALMIEGILVEELAEADVESVVPDRPGVRLRVVAGPYRGQIARLYRRMADKGKAKVDLDSGERVVVRLDDISQVAE